MYEYFDFIFPPRCIVCKRLIEGEVEDSLSLCEVCRESVEERGENFCPSCGVRHEGVTGESRCSECIKTPHPFERVIYRYVYGGAVSDIITSFKYHHNLRAGRLIVNSSLSFLRDEIMNNGVDLIVPVPIHFIKYFIRGFSPTAFIASAISKYTGIPVRYDILKKTHYTKAQVGLSRTDRLKNLRGSIGIRESRLKCIADKKVLLVDDVYTTGATASICAELILEGGSKGVSVFVLARGE
jgi:competence protein ComFC